MKSSDELADELYKKATTYNKYEFLRSAREILDTRMCEGMSEGYTAGQVAMRRRLSNEYPAAYHAKIWDHKL